MNQIVSFEFEPNNEQISHLPNFKSKMRSRISKHQAVTFHLNNVIQVWSLETAKEANQDTTFEIKSKKVFEYPDFGFNYICCALIDEKRQEVVFAFHQGEEEDESVIKFDNIYDSEKEEFYEEADMYENLDRVIIVTVSLENGAVLNKYVFGDEIEDMMLYENGSKLFACSGMDCLIQIRDWSHNPETHGQILKKLRFKTDGESTCRVLIDKVNNWLFIPCGGHAYERLIDLKTHKKLQTIKDYVELHVSSHKIKKSTFNGVYLFYENRETKKLGIWKTDSKKIVHVQDIVMDKFQYSQLLYSESLNALIQLLLFENKIVIWGIEIVLNELKEEEFSITLQREIPVSIDYRRKNQFLGEDDSRIVSVCGDCLEIVDLVTGKITKEQNSKEPEGIIDYLVLANEKSHLL